MSWIHLDDLVGLYVAALDGAAGAARSTRTAPAPATNKDFSKALGRALHRPAFAPVPGFAIRVLYGEMAAHRRATGSAWCRSARSRSATRSAHPDLDEALRDALAD